jgi:hypothetical protein
MHMAGETAQRAQRRKFKARTDQRLNGAVDEVREMRAAANDASHSFGRERRSRLIPRIDTEVGLGVQ